MKIAAKAKGFRFKEKVEKHWRIGLALTIAPSCPCAPAIAKPSDLLTVTVSLRTF